MIDRNQLRKIIREEAQSFLVDEGRTIEHPDACARRIADLVLARVPEQPPTPAAPLAETVRRLVTMLARAIPYLRSSVPLWAGEENARAAREIVDEAQAAIDAARRDLARSEVRT